MININSKHTSGKVIFCLIYSVSTFIWNSELYSQKEDLYVDTEYHNILINGRNTGRKYAVSQKMYDKNSELFRQAFFNSVTKQQDSALYYFYNAEGKIGLIEKTNINEELIGYSKYKYKKGNLREIKNYAYDNNSEVSTLKSKEQFKRSKNNYIKKVLSASNKILYSEYQLKDDGLIIEITTNCFNSDSINRKILSRSYIDTIVNKEVERIILLNGDTLTTVRNYKYNTLNRLEKIITRDGNGNYLYQTIFEYYPQGNLSIKRIISSDKKILKIEQHVLKQYFRELPRKKSKF